MNLGEFIAQLGWRPRLGDNSFWGWLTVVSYGVAAVLCFVAAARLAREAIAAEERRQRHMWTSIALLMTALGVNKQFDLQTLIRDVGRVIASRDGWYDERRTIQFWFVIAVAVVSVVAFIYLLKKTRSVFRGRALLLLGVSLLLLFVVMRAASFHHVGVFLEKRVLGLKMNWVLELGGIAFVAGSAARAAWRPQRDRQGDGRSGERAGGL
jgi:hypothetical protein